MDKIKIKSSLKWWLPTIFLVGSATIGTLGLLQKVREVTKFEKQAYQQLLSKFSRIHPGRGSEPTFPGTSNQPMTYAFVLLSEALRYQATQDPEACVHIQNAMYWLLTNADLDQDERPGWGLPDAWDAFRDGSINPPNHPYTITTSIVILGLLNAFQSGCIDEEKLSRIIQTIVKTVIYWSRNVWTDVNEGGFFWYSPAPQDSYFVPNVNAMMLGTLARVLSELKESLSREERKLLEDRIKQGARMLVATVNQDLLEWPYAVIPGRVWSPNDLVHHAYTIWGTELVRDYKPSLIPWSRKQAIESVRRYKLNEYLLEFPLGYNNLRKARLWGAGMALAVESRWGDRQKALELLKIIDEKYGPFPNLRLYPEIEDQTFYPRYAAHVLFGLAVLNFSRKN
ncbi:MAG: hypothetical protein DRG83_15780 [Deltaproteobacteria bacterium]|nr:MAG: hypothetical protein DRG83_15780 [Deltaproteobacteria bacterium]